MKQSHKLTPTDESRIYILRHVFRLYNEGKLPYEDTVRAFRRYAVKGDLPDDLAEQVQKLCQHDENFSSEGFC